MKQFVKTLQWRAVLALAVVALMTIGGCANRESKLVGQWKMDSSAIPPIPEGKTSQEKMGMEMAKKMFENITLDLKEDKTFVMDMMMKFSGNWKLDDAANTVTLKVTKMDGTDISKMPNNGGNVQKPLVLNIGADNTKLTMQPTGGSPAPADLTFVKQ